MMAEGKHRRDKYPELRRKIEKIVDAGESREEKLSRVCKLLRDEVGIFDWVGFYLAEEDDRRLVLGPFAGEPTEHRSIESGDGVCGQVAESEDIQIVQDVSREENYLSCSPEVQSEIVVPIFLGGKFIGELDIDSHTRSAFKAEDEKFLEGVVRQVMKVFDA